MYRSAKFVQLVHLLAVALRVDYLLRAEPVPKQESTGFNNKFILKPLPINRSTGTDPLCGGHRDTADLLQGWTIGSGPPPNITIENCIVSF